MTAGFCGTRAWSPLGNVVVMMVFVFKLMIVPMLAAGPMNVAVFLMMMFVLMTVVMLTIRPMDVAVFVFMAVITLGPMYVLFVFRIRTRHGYLAIPF